MNRKTRSGSPGSPARTGPPLPHQVRDMLCQDVALLAHGAEFSAQAGELFALRARYAVGSRSRVTVGLPHPLGDRLGGRLELAGEYSGG